jgi:hypothetical protein
MIKHRLNYENYKNGIMYSQHNKLFNAFDQYGYENFTPTILEVIQTENKKKLRKLEQAYHDELEPPLNKNVAFTGIDRSNIKRYRRLYNKMQKEKNIVININL